MRRTRKLGDILVERGLITQGQLEQALLQQQRGGKNQRLGEILIEQGLITDADLARSLAQLLNYPLVELRDIRPESEALALVPESLARKHQVIPITVQRNTLHVAMVNPMDMAAAEDIRRATGKHLRISVCSTSDFHQAFNVHYRGQLFDDDSANGQEWIEDLDTRQSDAEPVRLLKSWLIEAVTLGASDLHIDPQKNQLLIRMRLDGYLRDMYTVPLNQIAAGVISAIKVKCGMRHDEFLPQDGRFQYRYRNRPIDFRVSTLPTQYGDKVVIRIINHDPRLLDIQHLGFSERNLSLVKDLLERPSGIILVTGPTGSGKSTTLFAMLKDLNQPDVNIVTLEDPVEITLPRVNQVNIRESRGLDFKTALKAVVRQDPDILMIGELRGSDEVSLAAQLGLAGSIVLSTIHTNDAVTAPIRLIRMGVPAHILAATMQGVIAQRLVRRICPHCRYQRPITDEEAAVYKRYGFEPVPTTMWSGQGCPECFNTGYRGRIAIHEVLVFNGILRNLLDESVDVDNLRDAAVDSGMVPLLIDGLQKAVGGETTVQEVLREVYQDLS